LYCFILTVQRSHSNKLNFHSSCYRNPSTKYQNVRGTFSQFTLAVTMAYIVDCCRTAVGKKGGRLSKTHPLDMGAAVINELLKRNPGVYFFVIKVRC
jgi:hypothetical protein